MSPRSSANCWLYIGILLLRAASIIRPRLEAGGESGDDTARVKQVAQGAEGRCGRRFRREGWLEVRPSGGDEGPRAVREDQDEIKRPLALHPAEHREGVALQRMVWPDHGDGRREAIEVGSVVPLRSIA
jgi:hypothetical protein